jgi:hypothetical protein
MFQKKKIVRLKNNVIVKLLNTKKDDKFREVIGIDKLLYFFKPILA